MNSSAKLALGSFFAVLALIVSILISSSKANHQQDLLQTDMSNLNVFKKPLAMFSKQPMTGFYRDGFCRTGAADFGNHAVAGIVSNEFLDFTASQGNDLRVAGLTDGCKWCLCTSRWLEAFQAYKDGRIGKTAVPTVNLDATEDSALRKIDLETLKEFAAKPESNGTQ